MPDVLDNSTNEAGLPVVSKCRSNSGSNASTSGPGECGCKRRSLPPSTANKPPLLPETTLVETAALLTADEATTGTATMEETPPGAASCGCGHHAEEITDPQQAEETAGTSCKCQKMRWVRRTHSACGLVFGVFVVEHLAATALGLRPQLFEQYIRGLHAGLRQTPWLEVLVFLPLLTLVAFGIYLLAKAGLRYKVKKCKRGGKLRFFLQRVSAVVILAFIAFHLLTLRDWGPWAAATAAPSSVDSTTANDSAMTAFATSVQQVWGFLPSAAAPSPARFAIAVFYLLGTVAVIYHLANGLWTGAIAWGLNQSAVSQQRSLWAFTAFGIMLLLLGALGWYAFIVAPLSRAIG